MSKITSRFISLITFIFLLNIEGIRPSEAMNNDVDDELTLGQRIVKEAKNTPGYEPKNYGRHTRKFRQVVVQPQPQRRAPAQPQFTQQQLEERARQAELLRVQREEEQKVQQEVNDLAAKIKQFGESSEMPNDGIWQGISAVMKNVVPPDLDIPFQYLSKNDKEELGKFFIYYEKPVLVPLLEKIDPPTVSSSPQIGPPLYAGDFKFKIAFELANDQAIINSVLNASALTYKLENEPTLRSDEDGKSKMLKFLNTGQGLKDGFWDRVDCFDVITGNYGRYLKEKSSGKPTGKCFSSWKKQPAIIASSIVNGYPLILVAFKGTNFSAVEDFVSDFKAFPKNLCKLGNVHAGFYDIADSCIIELNTKINEACMHMKLDKTRVQILFTGHSMGAAVAAISSINQLATLATQLKQPLTGELNSRNNVTVINLGQPRIWKKETVNNFENILGKNNCIRLVAADRNGKLETVPGYRPNDTLGYDHFGHERVERADFSVLTRIPGLLFKHLHGMEYYKKLFGKY